MSIFRYFIEWVSRQSVLEQERAIFQCLERNPGTEYLDCAGGDGVLTLKMAKIVGTSKIFTVDTTEECLAQAREKGIAALRGDLNDKLPFENDRFDVVTASHVIEHLSNTDGFVKEILRVLKPGGYTVITTPNLGSVPSIVCLLAGKQPFVAHVSDEAARLGMWRLPRKAGQPPFPRMPLHRRTFTLLALQEVLEFHGLRVERSIGSGFYPLPASLAHVATCIDKWHANTITVKARKS